MTTTETPLHRQVLTRVVTLIGRSLNLDPALLTPDQIDRFARQDILGPSAELCGRPVDSLAIAEVLVDLDEDLGISILDWFDEDDGPTPLADIVSTLLDHTPAQDVERWLADHATPDPTTDWT